MRREAEVGHVGGKVHGKERDVEPAHEEPDGEQNVAAMGHRLAQRLAHGLIRGRLARSARLVPGRVNASGIMIRVMKDTTTSESYQP